MLLSYHVFFAINNIDSVKWNGIESTTIYRVHGIIRTITFYVYTIYCCRSILAYYLHATYSEILTLNIKFIGLYIRQNLSR